MLIYVIISRGVHWVRTCAVGTIKNKQNLLPVTRTSPGVCSPTKIMVRTYLERSLKICYILSEESLRPRTSPRTGENRSRQVDQARLTCWVGGWVPNEFAGSNTVMGRNMCNFFYPSWNNSQVINCQFKWGLRSTHVWNSINFLSPVLLTAKRFCDNHTDHAIKNFKFISL